MRNLILIIAILFTALSFSQERVVVYQNGEEIKRGLYPREDMQPLIGLDPSIEIRVIVRQENPQYDPATEKLVYFENPSETPHPVYTHLKQLVVGYTAVAMTQAEIDQYAQELQDTDTSAIKLETYKRDGVIGFDRAFALIQRRLDNGQITANQAKGIAQSLYPILEPLYKGQWLLVKVNLDAQTPPANAQLLDIFNKIKNAVDNYVSNNY
ncbi:hypothetical protein [Tenacibaculum sp.]|uniref:hypothetical protein n=1 Tax=Tenacibaculum sp. TaxID=1906242 RepID=UPI003D0C6F52